MAVPRDAVRRDAPDLERFPDGLAPELLVEIPATGDLGLLPKERQNLLDIVDPKAVRQPAYRRQALRRGDEPAVPVQE